jgi:hypothetical protein
MPAEAAAAAPPAFSSLLPVAPLQSSHGGGWLPAAVTSSIGWRRERRRGVMMIQQSPLPHPTTRHPLPSPNRRQGLRGRAVPARNAVGRRRCGLWTGGGCRYVLHGYAARSMDGPQPTTPGEEWHGAYLAAEIWWRQALQGSDGSGSSGVHGRCGGISTTSECLPGVLLSLSLSLSFSLSRAPPTAVFPMSSPAAPTLSSGGG